MDMNGTMNSFKGIQNPNWKGKQTRCYPEYVNDVHNEKDSHVYGQYLLETGENGMQPFYDGQDHEMLANLFKRLENAYEDLKEECKSVQLEDYYINWPENIVNEEGKWKVFGLRAFGRDILENQKLVPKSAGLLKDLSKHFSIKMFGFSSLNPGTYITPHKGYIEYSDNILRVHMGLQVPKGNIFLACGNQKRKWKEGKCWGFDDLMTHSAWNMSDERRIILLMDVVFKSKNWHEEENLKDATINCDTEDFTDGVKQILQNIDSSVKL